MRGILLVVLTLAAVHGAALVSVALFLETL